MGNILFTRASTSISGQTVLISGQPVQATISLSGVSFASNVSGNVVYLVSGFNEVQGTFTASISGQPINAVSGKVDVTILSQPISVSTSISGNYVSISGGVATSTSVSGNKIYALVFDASGGAYTDLWVNNSGQHKLTTTASGDSYSVSVSGNVVNVSGSPVLVSGAAVSVSGNNIATSISGNSVVTSSSGNSVNAVSGKVDVTILSQPVAVTTSVSGNYVNIASGSIAGFSGLAVSAAVTTNISGQTVYPVSGQAFAYIWDYSGLTWTQAATATSGSNKLLVDAGSISVNANVSGNYVAIISGSIAGFSGLAVSVSGNVVSASVSTNISGQVVSPVSGEAFAYAWDYSGLTWTRLAVDTSGSNKLLTNVPSSISTSVSGNWVNISGEAVSVSGNTVVTSVSGNTVNAVSGKVDVTILSQPIAVTTSVSGNWVNITSGSIAGFSGLAVSASGNAVTTSVSGNIVYYTSGFNLVQIASGFNQVTVSGFAAMSGIAVSASGNSVNAVSGKVDVTILSQPISTTTSVSGNYVNIASGSIAGFSGIAVSVSGNVVYTTSGFNLVQIASGFNQVTVSGFAAMSGIAVSASGNTVNAVSGKVDVTILSQPISVTTSVSGNYVNITSGSIAGFSGIAVSASGNAVTTSISGNIVYHTSGFNLVQIASGFNQVTVSGTVTATTSVSGNVVAIQSGSVAGFSGIAVSVSGNVIAGSVSGNYVSIVSGSIAGFSGIAVSVSGNIVNTSGQAVVVSSGVISIVSGSITVNSGQVAVSGLFTAGTAIQSGAGGISGGHGIFNFAYDPSGSTWNPVYTSTSGSRAMQAALASGSQASVSGSVLTVAALDAISTTTQQLQASTSGDNNRLRVTQEGMAPTYTVNVPNLQPISGGGAAGIAPLLALFHFGSGTAVNNKIKIKSLYIYSDANSSGNFASGLGGGAIKFDICRIKSFSGGGTNLSGVAMDTNDPVWSGTVQPAPAIQSRALSGGALDAVLFSYVMPTYGYRNIIGASGANDTVQAIMPYIVNQEAQMTNLIQQKMVDTRQIIIRSGYGLAIEQSSGNSYTQVQSGIFNISLTYSVE